MLTNVEGAMALIALLVALSLKPWRMLQGSLLTPALAALALLPWLWLAAGYVLDMWFQLVPGKWIVDSDLASEMMLAKILNQEGSILSHSWYYSTELRDVNMQ